MNIFLPKKNSFSLEELPEYLIKNYQIEVTHDDLIIYARENKIKTSVRLEGNENGIYSVGRIKLDERDLIPICYPPTSVFFNSSAKSKRSFLPHDLHLENDNTYLGARISMINAIYQEIQKGNLDFYSATKSVKNNINEFIEKSTYFPEYEYHLLLLPTLFSFSYSANFYLPRSVYNISTSLLESHIISVDFSDDSFYLLENTNKKDVFINLAICTSTAKPVGVHFKDIEVSYRDLMSFLGLNNITEENTNEEIFKIESLKLELEEKDKRISELQSVLEGKNYPIFLNKFMENDRLALAIKARKDYWANYDPNLNNAPKAEPTAREIKEKYGLSQKQAEAIEIIACPINRN